ncbi:hypothetical protein A2714_00150 [Candidatus Woesebacteria bacterium RIFCSPHIGHO2_01_FULL_38_9]|uniref:Aspartyl/glutamyl-tRNA(Asn/Gln) amidotransferase subunit B n=2 Tax=Candidatus Woeseibacteriota TaxID=1752722 RepID=A0A1F7Y2K5_9BACT|nr:MAG: hypothetical protein A2714_00150 [Candidatus Woesebacteria bacterium RIFCSPHIGHO2_01_FULL_38_9]OGM58376.1 MAG: hypothetical protein A3A75_04465 [Candidatus Woesebacteria bacterium RIFCSPLOWO2_01_FULL_39_10]
MVPTVGMETHVELRTNSKMFCGCPADHFGKKPNTQTCPVCLGLPGALPVPNKKAIEWTIMIALSLNCKINKESKFDRKHYFYPDLPKGYQISQYDEPISVDGYLDTTFGRVGIERIHIEEDTGKLQHKKINGLRPGEPSGSESENVSLVDFNRSGVPLVEIVTKPDIHSGSQAKEFEQKLQQVLRYIAVSDCDMEKGSMRLEANISWGFDWGYKVEVKNLNSFKFVDKAINYELERQKKVLEEGDIPSQETRGWSETENKTTPQRYKETAADYRYFPEPDIPPMEFSEDFINSIKNRIPELPFTKLEKFINKFKIRSTYAEILVSQKETAMMAEKVLEESVKAGMNPDLVAGILVNQKIDLKKISPKTLLDMVKKKGSSLSVNEGSIKLWVNEALRQMPQAVVDFKNGKLNALSALVGLVMQLSKGKADPKLTKKLLEDMLK